MMEAPAARFSFTSRILRGESTRGLEEIEDFPVSGRQVVGIQRAAENRAVERRRSDTIASMPIRTRLNQTRDRVVLPEKGRPVQRRPAFEPDFEGALHVQVLRMPVFCGVVVRRNAAAALGVTPVSRPVG